MIGIVKIIKYVMVCDGISLVPLFLYLYFADKKDNNSIICRILSHNWADHFSYAFKNNKY